MADPKWDDTTEVPPAWEDTLPHPGMPAQAGPVPSSAEALVRGVGQGAAMGFSDELQGGGQALYDKLLGNDGGKSLGDLYSQHTAEARAAEDAAKKAHPWLYGGGNLAGGLASGLVTGGLGAETAVGRMGVAAAMGGASGVGYGNADSVGGGAADALKGALVGGAVGGLAEGVGGVLSGDASNALAGKAETLAENATGATGAQAIKFQNKIVDPQTGQVLQESAGRQLLDKGIVGAFDNQAAIAAKANAAVAKSRQGISDSLNALDAQGAAPIGSQDIISKLQAEISAMKGRPSQAGTVKQMESILEDIKAGPSQYSLNSAEAEKRGFDDLVNYKNIDSNPANKAAADVYRETVENQAKAINPKLAEQFEQGKADYHLMKPIQEAAQKRAETTQQSPLGGLGDISAAGAGFLSGHPLLGLAAPVVRRLAAPRLASTAAVGADKLADVLRTAPDTLGPWASQLAAAAARGGSSLAATNMILSQTNQQYREHMKTVFGGDTK